MNRHMLLFVKCRSAPQPWRIAVHTPVDRLPTAHNDMTVRWASLYMHWFTPVRYERQMGSRENTTEC